MKQVKDKYTHTTLEQMPEHKLFRALMSGLNDFGFDCEAFANTNIRPCSSDSSLCCARASSSWQKRATCISTTVTAPPIGCAARLPNNLKTTICHADKNELVSDE